MSNSFNPQTVAHQAQTLSGEFLRQEYRSGLYIHTHTYIYKRLKGNFTDIHFFLGYFCPCFPILYKYVSSLFFKNVTFKITEMSKCYLSLTGFSFAWVTTGASQLPLCPHSLPLDSQPSLYCLQGCLPSWLIEYSWSNTGPGYLLPLDWKVGPNSFVWFAVQPHRPDSQVFWPQAWSSLCIEHPFPSFSAWESLICFEWQVQKWASLEKSYPWIPSRAGYCWLCSQRLSP